MKVELHLHTSRYSACAIVSPQQIINRLIDARYDAVYLTEHDAVWSDAELDDLRAQFPGLGIFPGVELTLYVPGMVHLLVLGTNNREYIAMDRPSDVIEKARDEGHLTVLAHPFRWEGADDVLKGDILPDAIEYCTNSHDGKDAKRAARAAESLGLHLVNTGDLHWLTAADRYWIETDRPVENADDIRGIVLDGAYEIRNG